MTSFCKSIPIVIGLIFAVGFSCIFAAGDNARNDSFPVIKAEDNSIINNTRLFFVSSDNGFIRDRKTTSPLFNKVPNSYTTSKQALQSSSSSTVIVQEHATQSLSPITLAGGIPGSKMLYAIIGAIAGFFIAAIFGQSPVFGVIIGALLGYPAAVMFWSVWLEVERNDFIMYVDNNTGQNIRLQIGEHSPVPLPGKSHVAIKLEEEDISIKAVSTYSDKVIDSFMLHAFKLRDHKGKKESGYYIYNIMGKNNYRLVQAAYVHNK